MEDSQIIELYWQKNADAISETSSKYGSYCFTIAVLPAWGIRIVQADFQPLNQAVFIPDRNQKSVWPGQRPVAVAGTKTGHAQQINPAGAEQGGE